MSESKLPHIVRTKSEGGIRQGGQNRGQQSSNSQSSTNLPALHASTQQFPSSSSAKANERREVLVSENGKIVETGKKNVQLVEHNSNHEVTEENRIPDTYFHKRMVSDDLERSKVGWENEIARHILAVYATNTAVKNVKESEALLDFVGNKHEEEEEEGVVYAVPSFHRQPQSSSGGSPSHNHNHNHHRSPSHRSHSHRSPQHARSPYHRGEIKSKPIQEEEQQEEYEDDFASTNNATNNHNNKTVKKKRRKKKKKPQPLLAEEYDKALSEEQARLLRKVEDSAYVSSLLQQIEEHGFGAAGGADDPKYRITNTIVTKDGQVITVRGSPKVYPIWFAASGEVYCDWTALPGGRRFMAHLSVLYERGLFEDYLGMLETILLGLHRRRLAIDLDLQEQQALQQATSNNDSSNNKQQQNKKGKKSAASSSSAAAFHGWAEGVIKDRMASPLRLAARNKLEEQQQQQQEEEEEDPTFAPPPADTLQLLWQQLVLAAIAVSVVCCERKKYDHALDILNRAEAWVKGQPELLPSLKVRKLLLAHVKDAMAYFFFKRQRSVAARSYAEQALTVFEAAGDAEMSGVCLLHIAAVHSQLSDFEEAHRLLFRFLAMVETGRLAVSEATPRQLCLIAIAYHNLAVVQLKLGAPDLACKSSQNARKVARLCLSHSNRWTHVFQYTHEVAIADMKHELSSKGVEDELTPQQRVLVRELAEALFAPEPVGT